jgi:Fe-S-cluster containining protein
MKHLPVIPPMKCDDNCGQCCGIVPASDSEYKAIVAYAKKHNIEPRRQGPTCPFYQNGKCSVHAVRPMICQVFGHSEKLVCPKGYNTNISENAIGVLLRSRGALSKDPRILHEILVETGKATDIFEAVTPLPSSIRPVSL